MLYTIENAQLKEVSEDAINNWSHEFMDIIKENKIAKGKYLQY